ncbi:hypothetical protein EHQ59_17660 [Leptospira kemamanensis]|uniref:Uncharacterized protein n=1 Tax=Leptospira kemamanensis TaxID=2484942 RepID=A0A4R9JLP2_9LEPT|nr:hypothetical protein [Leptospira kemamanensis]TGL46697.1 hypothetical protein EHQ59_17660 [Leptospira kemamanensis]
MANTFNIALFGEKNSNKDVLHFKEWSEYILSLCEKENMEPDYPSIRLVNNKSSNIKLSTYKNRMKKLENYELSYLDLTKSQPDFSYISKDWELSANIDRDEYFDRIYLGFDIDKFKTVYIERLSIISQVIQFMAVDYGFCFHMDLKYGPGLYVSGIFVANYSNIFSKFEKESTSLWSNYQPDAMNAVKNGKLRYLYEYNILNKSHLERKVFGKSLEDWVKSSLKNGTIIPINDKLYMWTIDPKNLHSVINPLIDQNIFLLDRNYKPNFD